MATDRRVVAALAASVTSVALVKPKTVKPKLAVVKRGRVAAEWRRDPYRTVGAVAEAAGCGVKLARRVRDELQAAGLYAAGCSAGRSRLGCRPRQKAVRAHVREALLGSPTMSVERVAALIGRDPKTVAPVRRALVAEGRLQPLARGRRAS